MRMAIVYLPTEKAGFNGNIKMNINYNEQTIRMAIVLL